MASVLFWLAVVTLVVVLTTIEFGLGNRSLPRLSGQPLLSPGQAPKVSVIVAARNEARKIEQGLRSLLAQDYPGIEFIVIDDRSTDETGRILDQIAGDDARLHVVHIADLPDGWLGKTHALHCGAEQATGELLLFTDADVVMERTVLSRAVGCLIDHRLDHLAVGPTIEMPGTLLSMFGGAFILFFGLYAKPWKARDPKSPRHIGIGAFNLVRSEVYRSVGGHRAIAMRPDDDIKLGKLIKIHGFRQDMAVGNALMTVEWYGSLGELVRGLEKNTYAGVEYNLLIVILATVAQWLVFLWPIAALFLTHGATWWLNVAIVFLLAAWYMDNAQTYGARRWHCIGGPVTVLLFQYIIWRATLKTLWNDGVDWRGTHYSLRELKANKV
ncbi:MAG TPA: glycosyltransferase family 2 protein [Verrucomicrobiae bacterium]|nr:glycosyltransferase family 2 protein [Verrucomicrobiae bacterium]